MNRSDDNGLPPTSVVIPTYNRGSHLAEVLRPLLSDPFPLEVIVVVDGSEDESMDVLAGLSDLYPNLEALWIPNSGEMEARAAGVSRAIGEIVLLLDDDVRALPGLAAGHAQWHARRSGVVVIGFMPTVVPRESSATHFTTKLYAQEYLNACERYEREPDRVLYNLWAGNMSLRRADAERVEAANSEFTVKYHQDREFGLRCIKAGLVGVFDRSLEAEHLHSREMDAFRREARAQGRARRELHELHPDLLGPLPPDEFRRGLSLPLRAIVRATRHNVARTCVVKVLLVVITVTETLRLDRLAVGAAKLLRRIEQKQGAEEGRVPQR